MLKGGNNQATNANEVAFGKYNKSNNGTQFSIGIGESANYRKNAVEVKQNGDIYIKGLGEYEGNNSDEAEDVATLMSTPITDAELDELFND